MRRRSLVEWLPSRIAILRLQRIERNFPLRIAPHCPPVHVPAATFPQRDPDQQSPQAVPTCEFELPVALSLEEASQGRLHYVLAVELSPQLAPDLVIGQTDQLSRIAVEDFCRGGFSTRAEPV